jgi:catechol 2,3-dioxygenase-like lactoylglutathione lyase family enzyme
MATKKKAKAKTKSRAAARGKSRPRRSAARKRPVRKKPESLRLRSASPTYTVNDVAKSQQWYHDVLGFTVGESWQEGGKVQGVELIAGEVTFYLTQDDWKKGRDRVKGEGCRVHCRTAQDVDAIASQVKARGGTFDRALNDEMGMRNFAVVDPDGYKITIAAVEKK